MLAFTWHCARESQKFYDMARDKTAPFVLVKALHDHHDSGLFWIVQARGRQFRPPVRYRFPFRLAFGLRHIVGIVHHQDITADAQKGAADTGRKARAALGIIDLDFRILVVAEGETRSQSR